MEYLLAFDKSLFVIGSFVVVAVAVSVFVLYAGSSVESRIFCGDQFNF